MPSSTYRGWLARPSFTAMAVVAALCVCFAAHTAHVAADGAAAPAPTTVFVCADSGEYSGAHELGFIHAALEEREALAVPHCQTAYLGYLTHADGHRFRALAVTTGIGYVSATLCTRQLLALQQERSLAFTAVVLIGTSGYSPMVGGWDPTNTSAAALRAAAHAGRTGPTQSAAPPSARAPPPMFQTQAERQWDAAQDLVTAAERGRTLAGGGGAAAGVRAVNNIAGNVNWEHVVSQRQVGPDGCSPMRVDSGATGDASLERLKVNQPLSIGSICVTSAAFLQESGYCTETLNTNQCSRPNCHKFGSLLSARNIHVARGAGSEKLVAGIVAASASKPFPALPEAVRSGMATFWRHNDAAATATDEDIAVAPTFVSCAESTMNAIFVGAERDYLCREYTATVLNRQWRVRQHRHEERGGGGAAHVKAEEAHGEPFTADNVVCVQAMEAFGFLEAMSAYPEIPVAVIRTASNYDMYPQQKLYVPPRSVTGGPDSGRVEHDDEADPVRPYVWRQNTQYVSREEYERFMLASFHYSVKTATFVVSNYFLGGRDLSSLTSTH